jgi:hypothetical protein
LTKISYLVYIFVKRHVSSVYDEINRNEESHFVGCVVG